MSKHYGRITNDMITNKIAYYSDLYSKLTKSTHTIKFYDPNGMGWFYIEIDNRTVFSASKYECYAWLSASCDTMRKIDETLNP